MDTQQDQVPQDMEELKDIPKWTRKYAQNRTLTFIAIIAMICLTSMGFAALVIFPLSFALASFRKGNTLLGSLAIAVLVAGLAATVKFYIFIFKKFGGKNKGLLDQKIDRWIYRREGFATMPQSELSKKKKVLDVVVGIAYVILLIGTMNLAMADYFPVKYHLPVIALFVVPFGIYQYFYLKPRLGPLLLLFPALFAIHALLILAGLPIFLTGTFAVSLNIMLTLAYNLLAFVIAHFYSRYALKKLKGLTALQGGSANGV